MAPYPHGARGHVLAHGVLPAAMYGFIDNKQTVQQVDVQQLQHCLCQNPLMMAAHPKCSPIMDDATSVSITGDWKNKQTMAWSFLVARHASATLQSVQFRPHVSMPGRYALYAYVPWLTAAATQTHYIIRNGTTKDVFIPTPAHAKDKPAANGFLSSYTLQKGNNTIEPSLRRMSTVMLVPMLFYLCRWNEKRKIFMSLIAYAINIPPHEFLPVIKPVWFYFDHSYYAE